jgi:membrane associated rhomboid family serine protease
VSLLLAWLALSLVIAFASAGIRWLHRRAAVRLPPPAAPPTLVLRTRLRSSLGLEAARPGSLIGLGFMVGLVLGAGLLPVVARSSPFKAIGVLTVSATFGTVLLGGWLVRWQRTARARPAPSIELFADRLHLPAPGLATVPVDVVPLAELREVRWGAARKGRRALLLGPSKGVRLVVDDTLEEPDAILTLHDALVDHLLEHGSGGDVLARSHAELSYTRRFLDRATPITRGVIGLLAAVYVVELLMAGRVEPNVPTLVRLGANAQVLVRTGQLWRLVTANVLHAGLLHIFFNANFILSFGRLLERALGSSGYVLVLVVSAIVGSMASCLVDPVSVGASTSCYGLLGALLVLSRRAGALPAEFRPDPGFWARVTVFSVALPFLGPISWAGHAGGFVGGVVVALLARPRDADGASSELGTRAAATAAAALFVAGLGIGAHSAWRDRNPLVGALRSALLWRTNSPAMLNDLAWTVAVSRESTTADLEIALAAAGRAATLSREPAARDTLAQVLHRLGREDEAVREQRRAYDSTPRPEFTTRLHRFLRERLHHRGAPMVDGDVGAEAGGVPGVDAGPNGAELVFSPAPSQAIRLIALGPDHLMDACFPARASAAPIGSADAPAVRTPLVLAYVSAGECAQPSAEWRKATDKEVLALP